MPSRLKRLVLIVTLLALPLQGVSATLSALLCHGDAQAHALHSPQAPDHAAHAGDHPDETDSRGASSYHSCCGHVVSAPPLVTLSRSLSDLSTLFSAPEPWHDLFVPELPHRPPLA